MVVIDREGVPVSFVGCVWRGGGGGEGIGRGQEGFSKEGWVDPAQVHLWRNLNRDETLLYIEITGHERESKLYL